LRPGRIATTRRPPGRPPPSGGRTRGAALGRTSSGSFVDRGDGWLAAAFDAGLTRLGGRRFQRFRLRLPAIRVRSGREIGSPGGEAVMQRKLSVGRLAIVVGVIAIAFGILIAPDSAGVWVILAAYYLSLFSGWRRWTLVWCPAALALTVAAFLA